MLLLAAYANAADPVKFWNGVRGPNVFYTTVSANCADIGPLYGYSTSSIRSNGYSNYFSGNTWSCMRIDDNGKEVDYVEVVQRGSGDLCSNGGKLDVATGECRSDEGENGEICEDQSGNPNPTLDPLIWNKAAGKCVLLTESDPPATCKYFGNKGSTPTEYTVAGVMDSGGEAVAPPTFAIQMGCEVQTVTTSECTINVKGAISCNVTGTFTGEVGQKGKPDVPSVSCGQSANLPCPTQEITTSVTDNPCVMASGKCTSETETSKTGKQQCGSVNGAYTCSTVKPTSNGLKIATEEMMQALADGSIKTTKTDKATKTKCTDVKACKITTSTTVTETTTNKEGKTTSKTSTCYGECGSAGTGLGTGLGGKGDGKGTGDEAAGNGQGDGQEGDGGAADASDDCTKPPPCDGDAYLCSILHQSFINSCAERALPTDKEKAAFKAKLDEQKLKLDGMTKEFDEKTSALVSAFESSASGASSGGKCFTDFSTSVMGRSFTIPFSAVCPYLEYLRWAVLCVAYLIALRIVTKEL